MSVVMEEEIKRWAARRKSALVLEIIQSTEQDHGGGGQPTVRYSALRDRELGR